MAVERITWQECAIGLGLIGIAAYFLWPDPVESAVQSTASPPTNLQSLAPAGLPTYMAANRPAYAVAPQAFPELANWPALGSLPMPDGLVRNADGSFSGGHYIGGNYVGGNVVINNPAVVKGAEVKVKSLTADCCGC